MAKPKLNLAAEAKAQAESTEFAGEITEKYLQELCPPEFVSEFKKAKSLGQRADFLYVADAHRLEVQRDVENMKKFLTALEKFFIQKLPSDDATGIAGDVARVQVRNKQRPSVKDWEKLYAHIAKTRSFDLLNRAPNQKAIKERWEAGVEIPGVDKFQYKDISVTKVN